MKQEKNERVEVYYERILKLTNNLQYMTINGFLTTIFRSRLQPYLCAIIKGMKKETLQQHKEVVLVCEEGIFEVEAISNLLVPQSNKVVLVQKPYIVTKQIGMYCTNCHRTNHNVETYRVKRKEDPVPVVSEVITQHIKV